MRFVVLLAALLATSGLAQAQDTAVDRHMAKAHAYAVEARGHARLGEILLVRGDVEGSQKEYALAEESHNKQMEEQDIALALQKPKRTNLKKVFLPQAPSQ